MVLTKAIEDDLGFFGDYAHEEYKTIFKKILMERLKDFAGKTIRLTDERLKHILDHPEMKGMISAIEETLTRPKIVVQSISDSQSHLYYRFYIGTKVGDKYLCVVVKFNIEDAFILTAYLTDSIKKGEVIWPKKL